MSAQTLNFLLQDCTDDEIKEHTRYVNGDLSKTSWIHKALSRREYILHQQLTCSHQGCDKYVNVCERGNALCASNHNNNKNVNNSISK
jgi:hypothetical protein